MTQSFVKKKKSKMYIYIYVYMYMYVYIYIYKILTAIWLTHGQLWAIIEGTASLIRC